VTARHAVVVGAGIGGLGAAHGLLRVGWRVTVLEQAERFEPVGAGITLMPNALRALDELGLGAAFRAVASVRGPGVLRTAGGRLLTHLDPADVQRILGAPMVALHRAELHRMLREPLPADVVRTTARVTGLLDRSDGRLGIRCPGDIEDADLVVAADGIGSTLRVQRWPEATAPAYSGTTTWRGITSALPGGPVDAGQTWGSGAEFGIVPLADGRIYWFGAVASPSGVVHADERAVLRRLFGAWHAPIPALIDAADTIAHHDIDHLPRLPAPFARGRVVLLGDAAHAMTPYLGQGGCQALEDAVVLAAALAAAPDVDTALAAYDRQRRPRVDTVRRIAARVGRMNALRNPLAVAARNALVRLTPSAVAVRGMAGVSGWVPPHIPTP
jgi:2-polyprenyl-6-methoxyphenol hydroxylase-like FAD-dependent oxidoreductase